MILTSYVVLTLYLSNGVLKMYMYMVVIEKTTKSIILERRNKNDKTFIHVHRTNKHKPRHASQVTSIWLYSSLELFRGNAEYVLSSHRKSVFLSMDAVLVRT